jgi:hypothetical protein
MGKSRVGSSSVLILKTGPQKYRGFVEPCYGVFMGKNIFYHSNDVEVSVSRFKLAKTV